MTFVLDATTKALKITIDAGAGADVEFVATYADSTDTSFTKGSSQGASNGSTAVDVVPAPAASTRRVVKAISFYNANATDPRTVTFYYDDNGTAYTIAKFTLQAGQSWYSETASTEEKGATVLDATNRTIKFTIDTAGSDVQFTAAWADSTPTTFVQGSSRGLSNGTSAVTIVGAPAASTRRLVQSITFYNAHASATRVVTLFYDDNGTTRTIAKFSLVAGDSWFSEVATFGIQPQGYVYAAPAVGSGQPSFRALGLSDVVSGSTGSGDVVLQTSPTIITPRIATIHTASSPFRAVVSFVQATNSANYLQITNAASGIVGSYYQGPILEAVGTGSDVDLKLKSKGLGNVLMTTSGLTVEPINSALSGIITVMGGTGTGAGGIVTISGGTNTNSGGQLLIKTNGNNEIGFRTPDSLAASVYYVLPAADGTNGQVLSTNGSGVLSWVTASGGGGISDGDKGDITVSGSGTVWTIDNAVVTLAKMADLATDRLIGRDSSGTGVPESLTVGGGIEFTGSGGIQTSAFTGDVTKTAGGTSTTIANDAVTFAKMQNVTSGVILGRVTASTGDVEEVTPGSGVLAWLQDATSAKLATAITDETGSGSLVFATSPTLTTPRIAAIHTASSPNNAALAFAQVASSVNYVQITNSATGTDPIVEPIGTDSDIGLILRGKGSGFTSALTLQFNAGVSVGPLTTGAGYYGIIAVQGGTTTGDGGRIALFEPGNDDYTGFVAPNSITASVLYTLPGADGSNGQFLTTNGSGVLSWTNQTTTLSGDVTGSGTTSITTTIANDAVTTAKILDANVTLAKIANLTAGRVIGRTGTTGTPQELTLTQTLDLDGTAAQGDILYRGASSWTRLGAGTRGRYLQTGGASANPDWATSMAFKNVLINGDMQVAQRGTTFDVRFVTFGTISLTNGSTDITLAGHGLVQDNKVRVATTGGGFTAGTDYYVIAAGLTANAFRLATAIGGAAITATATVTLSASVERPFNNNRAYTLDRWFIVSDGNDVIDVTQSTDAPGATTGGFTNRVNSIALDVETTNKKFGIAQIVERRNCEHLIGGVVSLSFKMKVSSTTNLDNVRAAVVAWSGTADAVTSNMISAWGNEASNPTLVTNAAFANTPSTITPTTSWATYTIPNISIDSGATNLIVFIWSNVTTTSAGEILYLTDVQLEPGPISTEYEYLPFDVQYDRCLRYLFFLKPGNNEQLSLIGEVINANQNVACGYLFTKVMRTSPTLLSTGSASDYNVTFPGVAANVLTEIPSLTPPTNEYGANINLVATGALTVGRNGHLRTNTVDSFFGFDAEL